MNVFSDAELKILKIVGRRKMHVTAISDSFYEKTSTQEERNYIAGVVRRIKRKCDRYHMTWTIDGKGGGRSGRIVWRAKRHGNPNGDRAT